MYTSELALAGHNCWKNSSFSKNQTSISSGNRKSQVLAELSLPNQLKKITAINELNHITSPVSVQKPQFLAENTKKYKVLSLHTIWDWSNYPEWERNYHHSLFSKKYEVFSLLTIWDRSNSNWSESDSVCSATAFYAFLKIFPSSNCCRCFSCFSCFFLFFCAFLKIFPLSKCCRCFSCCSCFFLNFSSCLLCILKDIPILQMLPMLFLFFINFLICFFLFFSMQF